MGFLSTVSQCTAGCTREQQGGQISEGTTHIIPDMSFTCNGTVTYWRAAGEFRTNGNAKINSVLSIWRSNEPGTYDRIERVELGICGTGDQAPLVMGMTNVYECTLLQTERVSVQPGDIVGIELPLRNDAKFRLHFDNTNGAGPANYVFNNHNTPQTLDSFTRRDQPQISLTVEPTTVQPPITEASTTAMTTETRSTTTDVAQSTSMAEATTRTMEPQSTTTEIPPTTTAQVLTTTSMENSPTAAENATSTTVTALTSNTDGTRTEATDAMTDTTTMDNSATASTVTTVPPSVGDSMLQQNDSGGTIAGSAVGGIIAVLLVLIIVLLLVLVLRRQNRNGQKFTPSNNATIVNPVYDGKPIEANLAIIFLIHRYLIIIVSSDNIAVQIPNPDAQDVLGVYSMADDIDHTPAADYEDIDNKKPTLPPSDMFLNSINDYSKTPHPIEMSAYETPVQTLTKVCICTAQNCLCILLLEM